MSQQLVMLSQPESSLEAPICILFAYDLPLRPTHTASTSVTELGYVDIGH